MIIIKKSSQLVNIIHSLPIHGINTKTKIVVIYIYIDECLFCINLKLVEWPSWKSQLLYYIYTL